ncbi:MAG TPA: HTH domain-containing protein [bacterium]|nr:HTH domain-containing protein [bacterium]
MHPRQKQLFLTIVEEYIKTAEPVSSKLIAEKFNLDVSPATIRNDMMELESADLIYQPHVSAGRVPTEFGYKKFVTENVDLTKEISNKVKEEINKIIKNIKVEESEIRIKSLAKIMAEKSGLAIFVGFKNNDVYYTGLSNLFSEPEFKNTTLVCNLTAVLDHLDEVMLNIYEQFNEEVMVKIGKDNLFANDCSIVVVKIKNILFGIIGPMRMDYQKNVELINLVKSILG